MCILSITGKKMIISIKILILESRKTINMNFLSLTSDNAHLFRARDRRFFNYLKVIKAVKILLFFHTIL